MEWNQIEQQWPQLASKLHQQYASISEDELKFMEHDRAALVAKIRQRTGLDANTAEVQLDSVIAGLAAAPEAAHQARPPAK